MSAYKTYNEGEMKIHNNLVELATYCKVPVEKVRKCFYQSVSVINGIKVIKY